MSFDIVKTSYDAYQEKLNEFVLKNPRKKPFLETSINPDEVKEFIVVRGLNAGVYIKNDGELAGLFNGSGVSGIGEKLVRTCIERGADHLNCFDGRLTSYYESLGFEEVNRIEWDEDYAPSGWDYGKFGKPDVVEMRLRS